MNKILILGSGGFFAAKLIKRIRLSNFKVFLDKNYKKKLKKKNFETLEKIIKKTNPDTVVNLAALTNVNECQKKKKLARTSNCSLVRNLVKAIKRRKKKIHLIHFSTDQVYNGKGNHNEIKTGPKNYYGLSKLNGEKFAMKTNSTILRVNFIGSSSIKNKITLSDWIVSNVKKKIKIKTFKNIFFSPLHTSTLATLIIKIIKMKKNGIFNIGSKTKISKAIFAELLCKILRLDNKYLIKTNYSKEISPVLRPFDMSLNVGKFEKTFKIKLPKVTTEIKKLSKEYR
mgnify:FL=1